MATGGSMQTQTTGSRTFRGRNSSEVLSLIKQELGADAVILSTRSLARSGKGASIEITAVASNNMQLVTPTPVRMIMSALENNGLGEDLVQLCSERYRKSARTPDAVDHLALRKSIASLLPVRPHRANSPRILALVGPTGVGKTTTIAKLAISDRQQGKRVGLITIDTHRIGGVEQLGRYAALLGAPMKTAATPEELVAAVEELQDQDQIYIDTAGSGPRGEDRLRELSTLLDALPEAVRLLLLPASGNQPDLERMVESFAPVQPTLSGVTKTDETCYFGPCFNVLCQAKLPLSLFGTGQTVPDDLEDASSETLVSMLTRVRH